MCDARTSKGVLFHMLRVHIYIRASARALRATSVRVCPRVSLRRGTVEHEHFGGLVQRCSANSMVSYVTGLARCFPPSGLGLHLHLNRTRTPRLFPISRSTSSQQASLSHVLIWCGVSTSAGANGPDINELGDSDILRDIMNELPCRRPLLHGNDA